MFYEDKEIISIVKPLENYNKKYVICALSSEFWVAVDETNYLHRAKDIVNELELDDNECIIIKNSKERKLK